jgi:nitrate/nitrite-specific signal transduction histidine kinase
MPITGPQGEFVGTIAGMFRVGATTVSAFYDDIVKLRIVESGSAYLVDGNGQVIYYTDTDRIADDVSAQEVVQQVLSGQVGAVRTRDLDGQEIVASFAPVSGTSWGLVTQESWAALTHSSRGYGQFLLLLLALGVVVPALVVAVGVRRITRPITELIGAAQEVAGGNFGQAITARTGDEIEELAEQFNLMAAQLQESYAHLEQRLVERVRAEEALGRYAEQLEALRQASLRLTSSLVLQPVLDTVLEHALQLIAADDAHIFLYDGENLTFGAAFWAGDRQEEPYAEPRQDGLTYTVARTGERIVVPDVDNHPLYQGQGWSWGGAIVGLPLRIGEQVCGVMSVAFERPHTFDESELRVLELLADQAAVAIENARLHGQVQQHAATLEQRVADRTKELATLNAVVQTVSQSLELEAMLTATQDKVLEVLEFESGAIYLKDLNTGELQMACHRGLSNAFRRVVAKGIISARASESGNPIIIDDLFKEPDAPKEVVEEGYRSVASIPLFFKGQSQGVLTTASRQLRRFRQEDVDLLLSIGHQIGVAIENARERRMRQEATLLAEMAKLISGTLDLDEVLRLTTEYAIDVFDVHCCCILLYDEGKATLRSAAQIGFDDQVAVAIAGAEFSPSEGMRRMVFEALQPLIVEDVPSDPHLSPQDLLDLQSALVVPIEVGGRRLGAIQLGTQRPTRRRFTAEEGELALAMANQAAMAIDNARHHEAKQRRAEQFRVISEVGRRMTSIMAADELLWEIARLVKETLGYYLVGIGLIEGDELIFKAGAGAVWETPGFQPPRLKVGREGITSWVAQSGEPLLVPDVSQEPRYYSLPQASEMRSELAVPLKTKEAVIGVLHVQSDRLNAFDESDLGVLQSLAHQAAIAIENAQLYEQAQELAVVEERQRLARDLHDAVTQTLFSASLIADVLPRLWERNPDEGRRRLEEVRQLTRGALAEMRTLLLELRPAALAEAKLSDLLRQLAESITGRARVPVTLAMEGQRPLPLDVKVALYRIAHEALNNVAKHAGASQATVNLRCRPEQVELHVSDDGRGFDPEGIAPESLGLGIMRERAEAIGATLTVESEIGRGTEVMVIWPDIQKCAKDD